MLEGGLHADPPWHENQFQIDGNHPAHPTLRKYSWGPSPQLSAESCECERSRTVRQKVPRPTFRNFLSSCRMLLQQRIRIFSTFRTVSAGLSAWSFRTTFRRTFRTKLPLDFPQGFRTDACRALLPKCFRILKESASRTQYPAETGLTNRSRTDARKQSDREFSDRFLQGLTWGLLQFSADLRLLEERLETEIFPCQMWHFERLRGGERERAPKS